jgi:hypothetical protein
MISPDFTELENYLTLIGPDRALIESFKARNPALVRLFRNLLTQHDRDDHPNLSHCPGPDDLTAVALTIFDNWKGKDGKRKRGSRWGAQLKAYDQAPVKNWGRTAWKAEAFLWPAADAVAKAKALSDPTKFKCPLTADTLAYVGQVVEMVPDAFIGVFAHRHPNDGTLYYDSHLMWIEVDGDVVTKATMFSPRCNLNFSAVVGVDAKGDPLGGRAVAMARLSDLDSMSGWATGGVRMEVD